MTPELIVNLNATAAAVVLFCSFWLVFDCLYRDGLLGRLALVGLCVAEWVTLLEWWHNEATVVAPTTLIGHLALALFMARHLGLFLYWHRLGARG